MDLDDASAALAMQYQNGGFTDKAVIVVEEQPSGKITFKIISLNIFRRIRALTRWLDGSNTLSIMVLSLCGSTIAPPQNPRPYISCQRDSL
ncbi:unnamed protein product [Fusarium graminearum]|uniref:Uncharacterized protein n=1 Tax=Gibberella zeae TaxID=5518 RepID=A0A4E9EMZ9_GIBZA|nr:unnamed protein product [Fusarium graminearum]